MYNVFLVDDEIVVREGIRSNFPWDDTEFALAGEAPDGEIALAMLQDIKPDILITDIRMPFMDGLQLCRTVTRTMPWIYVVILSGYDDFAYAREAISLGVKEYLLKPVSGQELLAVLERIAVRIREDKRQQANMKAFREQFASSSRFLKEKLLLDLIAGVDAQAIEERARALQLNLTARCYCVMLLAPQVRLNGGAELMPVQSVLHRLTDGSGGAAHLCGESGGTFALLVLGDNASDLEERAYGLAQAAQYDVERNTAVRLLVGIGGTAEALSEVPASLRDAQTVLERMRVNGAHAQAPRIMGMQDVVGEEAFSLLDLDVTPIAEQLKHAGLGDVNAILTHYASALGEGAAQSTLIANYMFVDILLAASRMIKESGGVPQEVIPAAFRTQAEGAAALPAPSVLKLAREMLEKAIEFRDSQGSARYGSVIRKAKALIAERFHDSNLTLSDVASHVALSNNHFCTVFSQEMGVTFTEYLTATRIARAKELLSTAMRTSDVAYAVGYNDPHYFSYLFKKNTGLSPRDYRKEEGR
ncbi:MAG: response regulator [Christensenellaceae bacterium]|nr:response regulator [Christensenellaceae bacterium]MEA5069325.1 response regulator [Christensenellaceae bacterium]